MYNALLATGAFVMALLAMAMTYFNGTANAHLTLFLLGTMVALGCALIAIGIDLQASVSSRLGALANTSILQSWQGWACLIGWGMFCVVMFQIAQLYPDWASETLHFKVNDNLMSTGLIVGISALVIIRSKLTKVNEIEWGGEWLYLWSSAQVLDAVNRRRVYVKREWETKLDPYVSNLVGQPTLFTDLENYITPLLAGWAPKTQTAVTTELSRLRGTYIKQGDPNPDATINQSVPARRYLISAILDHLGNAEIQNFAIQRGLKL